MSGKYQAADGIDIHWFARYLGKPCEDAACRDARYLVRAIKRIKDHGSVIRRLPRSCKLETATLAQALAWFGEMGAVILAAPGRAVPVVLIPMPDSDCTVERAAAPRTVHLASAIAEQMRGKAVVCDSLRWKRKQTASHTGGSRDPLKLCRELAVVRAVPAGYVVAVDDVMTTGGHLIAASAKLQSVGVHCRMAITLARTGSESFDHHFFGLGSSTLVWALHV